MQIRLKKKCLDRFYIEIYKVMGFCLENKCCKGLTLKHHFLYPIVNYSPNDPYNKQEMINKQPF